MSARRLKFREFVQTVDALAIQRFGIGVSDLFPLEGDDPALADAHRYGTDPDLLLDSIKQKYGLTEDETQKAQ